MLTLSNMHNKYSKPLFMVTPITQAPTFKRPIFYGPQIHFNNKLTYCKQSLAFKSQAIYCVLQPAAYNKSDYMTK